MIRLQASPLNDVVHVQSSEHPLPRLDRLHPVLPPIAAGQANQLDVQLRIDNHTKPPQRNRHTKPVQYWLKYRSASNAL